MRFFLFLYRSIIPEFPGFAENSGSVAVLVERSSSSYQIYISRPASR